MKIHTNQIPVEGLHLEGEEERDILELQDEKIRALAPVHYSIDVGLSQGGLFATGTIGVNLELECVTCLEKFEYPLAVPDFAVQVELGTAELVDLTDSVREDILLALPPYPHCDWNGAHTCAGLRINHAIMPEQQIEANEPPRKNPWTALDELTKPKD